MQLSLFLTTLQSIHFIHREYCECVLHYPLLHRLSFHNHYFQRRLSQTNLLHFSGTGCALMVLWLFAIYWHEFIVKCYFTHTIHIVHTVNSPCRMKHLTYSLQCTSNEHHHPNSTQFKLWGSIKYGTRHTRRYGKKAPGKEWA